MRGVDTNVLVRYLTDDDPTQSPLAQALIHGAEDEGERLYISTIVMCELCWTLRGKRYRYDRPTIAAAFEKMLDARVFEFENRSLVACECAAAYAHMLPRFESAFQGQWDSQIDQVPNLAQIRNEEGYIVPTSIADEMKAMMEAFKAVS